MTDFIGSSEVQVDEKGRFAFPFRFRRLLAPEDDDTLVLMPGFEGEIMAFPKSAWELLQAETERPNPYDKNQRIVNRRFSHDSEPCKCDKQGRIMISAVLRKRFGINGAAIVAGSRGWLEIWDKQSYEEIRKRDDEVAVELANQIKLRSSAPPGEE